MTITLVKRLEKDFTLEELVDKVNFSTDPQENNMVNENKENI